MGSGFRVQGSGFRVLVWTCVAQPVYSMGGGRQICCGSNRKTVPRKSLMTRNAALRKPNDPGRSQHPPPPPQKKLMIRAAPPPPPHTHPPLHTCHHVIPCHHPHHPHAGPSQDHAQSRIRIQRWWRGCLCARCTLAPLRRPGASPAQRQQHGQLASAGTGPDSHGNGGIAQQQSVNTATLSYVLNLNSEAILSHHVICSHRASLSQPVCTCPAFKRYMLVSAVKWYIWYVLSSGTRCICCTCCQAVHAAAQRPPSCASA